MPETLPRSDDLEATWAFIEPGIRQILGKEVDVGVRGKRVAQILTPTMYMEIYTAIYNYCVSKSRSSGHFSGDTETAGSNDTTAGSSKGKNNNTSILVGSEIYAKLKDYLISYINAFQKPENETFLQFYVRKWKRFTIGAVFLNHAFDYMNRYWVQKERSDGKRHIFDVNTLCLITWKQVMFDPNSDLLVKEILEQITHERRGQIIQRDNIATAIKSLVALGIDPQDLKKLNLNVYIQVFEKKFLETTEQFYTEYSQNFLQTQSVTDYIFELQKIISNEEKNMSMYWDHHTKKPLSETLNDVLIKKHIDQLESEFIKLLNAKDSKRITALYNLMQRDFSLLPRLADKFEAYVKQFGESQVIRLIDEQKSALNTEGAENSKKIESLAINSISAKDYIKKLLEIHDMFRALVNECFPSDTLFTKALDNACRSYINNNEYAFPLGASRNSTSRTSEVLAKYSDLLLKKSTRPEMMQDMNSDDIITIFKFLNDKDAFESHYRRLFAKRLIHGTSTSAENEEAIIKRLQTENSMEYTGKITKMFQDVRLSKILEDDFEMMVKSLPDYDPVKYPDLEPFVLAENMWPFSYQEVGFQLPSELQASHSKLEGMYMSKHNGRVLKWLWPLCRGEVVANIGKPGRPPFVFTMTLFQTAIVLQFNYSDVRTLAQLQHGTQLSVQNVAGALVPLIKYKLVQQVPPGLEHLAEPETEFRLARPYKAIKTHINFAGGVKNDVLNGLLPRAARTAGDERADEHADLEKELDAERHLFLEACIVRIMKSRRHLPHATLVNECIAQSHRRFAARVPLIKRAIDTLIQKGYLQRGADGESYTYLA